jgi:cytokinesis protein
MLPTNDETELILGYDGEPSTLANAERFLLSMVEIKGINARLEMWMFKQTFNTTAEELEVKVETIEKASRAVTINKNLQQVLQVVLALGNYLNGSSHQGGAYGFKLATLGKLKSTKTVDNKSNLLAYIVQYVTDKMPEVARFVHEMAAVKDASAIEAAVLESEVSRFYSKYPAIKSRLESKEEEIPGDQFVTVMKAFYDNTRARAERIKKRLDEAKKSISDVLAMFGEPRETKPEEFFQIFANFINEWQQCVEDQERVKAAALAEKKRQELQLSMLEKKKRSETIKLQKAGAGGKELVDNVMNAINSDAQSIRNQIQARRRSIDATKRGTIKDKLYEGPKLEDIAEKKPK